MPGHKFAIGDLMEEIYLVDRWAKPTVVLLLIVISEYLFKIANTQTKCLKV